MMHLRTASGVKNVASISVRTAAGLKGIDTASIRTASGVKEFFAPGGGGEAFIVSVSNYTPKGSVVSPTTTNVTTSLVSLASSAGQAPYSYTWSQIGSDPLWQIAGTFSANARFNRNLVTPGGEFSAQFICTVTDARGRQVVTAPITATVYNYG